MKQITKIILIKTDTVLRLSDCFGWYVIYSFVDLHNLQFLSLLFLSESQLLKYLPKQ